MSNYYKEFQKNLAKKLLEAELKLIEKEKDNLLKDVLTANDRVNIDTQLFKLDLQIQKTKENYARNILYIESQGKSDIYHTTNDIYHTKNIYTDF